jgi:UDP-N-acetylmuramoylalanine--D-glutamate ligase
MKITYTDFKSSLPNLKVLVWGIGIAGGGVNIAKYFAENGSLIRAIDIKDREALKESVEILEKYQNIEIHLGEHKVEDFLWADLIIKNPAVPPTNEFLKVCRENNKKVETEISLFMKYAEGYKIGITGTRGKSTTTALLTHVLQSSGKSVFNGGNNRTSLINQIEKIQKDDLVVMEISSFMCDSLRENKISPNLSIITNIYPDHLNWHPSMQHYIDSKGALIEFQSKDDVAILNTSNEIVKENYSSLGNGKRFLLDKIEIASIEKKLIVNGGIINAELEGAHNLENISLVWEASKYLGISENEVLESIKTFNGLEYRQQKVCEKSNVIFINDSTSTMPQATIVCLERFASKGNVHLIIGGVDKNLPVEELIEKLKLTKTIHWLEGSLYEKIMNILNEPRLQKERENLISFGPYGNMSDAVSSAYDQAKDVGGYVILSPSAASFNLFKNEFDRGQKFDEAVSHISPDPQLKR